jgi:hypothetical protein
MAAETIKDNQISKPIKSKSQKVHELIKAGCQQVNRLSEAAGCDKALASRILKTYNIKQEHVITYKEHRADIFAGIQQSIMSSINSNDIKKASLFQKAGVVGLLYDKERLERGLADTGSKPLVIIVKGNAQIAVPMQGIEHDKNTSNNNTLSSQPSIVYPNVYLNSGDSDNPGTDRQEAGDRPSD